MELSEIKQFTHKIKKINIKNKNTYSLENYVTMKITLTDVEDDEIIRFSLEPNSDYIQHQSFNNDYFVIIPNKLNDITTLYAHYFISDLYDYEEEEEIFSIYNFAEILEENPTDVYFENEYKIHKKIDGYEMESDVDGFYVRSLLNNSLDKFKNPNYKNFIKTNLNDDKDMTFKGTFPISSRYRLPYKYPIAPNLNETPKWEGLEQETTDYTQLSPSWEVRINRNGLSPLIAETIDKKYAPINVYLNYQYLPTSTDYHQHYFGFEGQCPDETDYYILEGTNLNQINENFGSKNNYRIVQRTNPYDDTYSMFVDHEYELPISLLASLPKGYITQDKCHDYYVYTGIGYDTPRIIRKDLNAGELYSLKYFIYIPDAVNADCYLKINGETIEQEFLEYDNKLRNEWIYHEIPFYAETKNTIEIIGPNKDDNGKEFFLTQVAIKKFVEYSPTLKYNQHGLSVYEQDQYATRLPDSDSEWILKSNPTNVWQEKISLPNPTGKVLFTLNADANIDYDKKSTSLYYSHLDDEKYELKYYKNNKNEIVTNSSKIIHEINKFNDTSSIADFIVIDEKIDRYIDWEIDITYETLDDDDKIILLQSDDILNEEKILYKTDISLASFHKISFHKKDNELKIYLDDVLHDTQSVNYHNVQIGQTSNIINNIRITSDKYFAREGDLTQANSSDISLIYDEITSSLYYSHIINSTFYKGKNNSFSLYLNDEYNKPVNHGTVECDIMRIRSYVDDDSLIHIGPKNVQKNGMVYFDKIDLSSLELINDEPTKYYLRIKYSDICTKESIYDFKIIYIETSNTQIEVLVNGNSENSKYTKDGKQDCDAYQDMEYFEDIEFEHYPILDKDNGGYIVYDIEKEFPLKVEALIFNQIKNSDDINRLMDGYCELSVNDKVIQTTIVDSNGIADFYLDLEDIKERKQTIKIEYYNKYWESIKFVYFDLTVCSEGPLIRPAIPIIINFFEDSKLYYDWDEYSIPQDDTLLFDINTAQHTNFKIEIYEHKEDQNNNPIKNIKKFNNDNSILIKEKNIYNVPNQDNLFLLTGLRETLLYEIENVDGLRDYVYPTLSIDELNNNKQLVEKIKQQGKGEEVEFEDSIFNLLLYAPIKEIIDNKAVFVNNGLNKQKIYSIVTKSLDRDTNKTYRSYQKSFAINYMDYTKNNNYQIIYNISILNGIINVSDLQIKENGTEEIIQNGHIEVYFDGEMLCHPTIKNGICTIPNISLPDNNSHYVQFRYVFKNGYEYIDAEYPIEVQ